MGELLSKCMAPSPPPVVFTICPQDGKAHDFGTTGSVAPNDDDVCKKCGKKREQIDYDCQECRNGDHNWVQDVEPVQPAPSQPPVVVSPQAGVVHGTPVVLIHKCTRCGLRQRMGEDGLYYYDDYFMYGGGFMMGMEMGLAFGIMGTADAAYADPMYSDYYGVGEGFAADEDMDDMDFGFD